MQPDQNDKTSLHKIKLKKNLTVLAIIVGLVALIFAITIIKISSNA